MSSVGVVTQKKSKCFVRKKILVSEEKFSKCGKGENVSVKFWVFEKKKEIERKVPGKKNQSFFLVKI